ncbi:MAG TPA: GNAT family N-acetyltransferase [Alphaproteobacteria bacterium]|nr:GNAT family N-acetyltransferase [Alphaproteobacteria bacterium]
MRKLRPMDLTSFTVETERLLLRVVDPGDAVPLAGLMTPGISRWVAAWPYPLPVPVVDGMISDAIAAAVEGRTLPMVITTKEDRRIVGWIKLDRGEAASPTAELGYWIGEEAQGKGFAYEAAAAVIDAGFDRLNVQAVEAGAQPSNAASHRLLRKLGMHEIGERCVFAPARQRYGICQFWRIERPTRAGQPA